MYFRIKMRYRIKATLMHGCTYVRPENPISDTKEAKGNIEEYIALRGRKRNRKRRS